MRDHIVEVNILVAPFEVMDDTLVCQFLLDNEYVLEEVNDSLVDIEVVELCYHRLLIFEVPFVSVN